MLSRGASFLSWVEELFELAGKGAGGGPADVVSDGDGVLAAAELDGPLLSHCRVCTRVPVGFVKQSWPGCDHLIWPTWGLGSLTPVAQVPLRHPRDAVSSSLLVLLSYVGPAVAEFRKGIDVVGSARDSVAMGAHSREHS